jgi:tripartite ATP-independent transporter DctM subunit
MGGIIAIKGVINVLGKVCLQISRGANLVGLITLGLMAVLVIAGIMGRYFFLKPITGSYEILQLMMIIPAAAGLAYTALHKGHISIGLVKSRFSSRNQAVIDSAISFLSLGVFAVITWQAVLKAESLRLEESVSQMLQIPVFPFLYVLAAGSAILCLVFICNIFEHMARVVRRAHGLPCARSLFFILLALALFATPLLVQGWLAGLNRDLVGILGIIILMILLVFGMPVAVALTLTGFLGIICLEGVGSGFEVFKSLPFNALASYTFIGIPLFLLMTAFIQQSGIAQSIYLAAVRCFRHLPGGHAISSIAASALNATVSVSSQSNAAVLGSVALPQMKKNNPDSALSVGDIAAGSTITLLIPPSIGLILYAILSELSIVKVFLAGLIPGLLLSVFFLLYAYFAGCSSLKAGASPPAPSEKRFLSGFIMLLPVGIWLIPLFGLYAGIFTPTEAAAAGVLTAFIMAASWTPVWGRSIVSVVKKSLLQALHTTCMVGLILIGTVIFHHFINLTALPVTLANFVTVPALSPAIILIILCLVFVLLVYFLEPLTVIVIGLPVLSPAVTALDYDPVWFGVILMVLIGLGMLLSPYRLNLQLAGICSMGFSYKKMMAGVLPYAILMVVLLIFLVVFPQIALWLPGLLW